MLQHRCRQDALLVCCHLLLLTIVLLAPRPSRALDLDTLINHLQASFDKTTALTADFVQIATLSSLNRHQTSSGRLFIAKPSFIRWEYTHPDAQTIIYDGALLQIYTPQRHQVLQSPIGEQERGNVAFLFLAGVGNLRETFKIEDLGPDETGRPQLRLLPRSPQASFKELIVAINSETFFVEKITIHDTIENITNIYLYSLTMHKTLPPQTFILDMPAGTEVIKPSDFSSPN